MNVRYHGGAAVRRVRHIPHDLLLFFSDLEAAWCAVGPRETAAADGGDAPVIITFRKLVAEVVVRGDDTKKNNKKTKKQSILRDLEMVIGRSGRGRPGE